MLLLSCLLFVLLLSWTIGSYARLTQLRASCSAAFLHLDDAISVQMEPVQLCTMHSVNPSSPKLLENLRSKLAHFLVAKEVAKLEQLDVHALEVLNAASVGLDAAWTEFAQADVDLAGALVPDTLQQMWRDAAVLTHAAEQVFNDQVAAYHEALSHVPAQWWGKTRAFPKSLQVQLSFNHGIQNQAPVMVQPAVVTSSASAH